MENFTPLTRRAVALGLLLLMALIVVIWVAVPLVAANQSALEDLANVRRAYARIRAQVDGPEALSMKAFPAKAALWGGNHKTAADMLAGRLATLAASDHLELRLGPTPAGQAAAPSLVSMELSATGAREDVIRFMNALEMGAPQIRFRRFHLSRIETGPAVPSSTAPAPSQPDSSAPVDPAAASVPAARLRLDAEAVALWGGER